MSTSARSTNPPSSPPIIRSRPFRIVTQTVPPGTPVPKGAVVDVTVTAADDFPLFILEGVLVDLKSTMLSAAYNALITGHPEARTIVSSAAKGLLSTKEVQQLEDLFASSPFKLALTAETGRDIAAAVETLRLLIAFGDG
jgi:hypothetical protein